MMNKVSTCNFYNAVLAAKMMMWLVSVVTLTPHGADAFTLGTATAATTTMTSTFVPKSSTVTSIAAPAFASRSHAKKSSPVFKSKSSSSSSSSSCTSLSMCICINYAHVTNCAAYHFVETKHDQPHMTDKPTFEPRPGSPTIHVNVRTIRNNADRQREIERMWREHKAETKRAELKAAATAAAAAAAEKNKKKEQEEKVGGQSSSSLFTHNEKLYGETVYDFTPITTYEYDVVKCEDYVHDEGCWVRNMPQEIRDANPNFVPS